IVSVPLPESRLRSFILTTDALRPDFENSAFCTTIGLAPIMMTLPARTSWASFMVVVGTAGRWRGGSRGDFGKLVIIVERAGNQPLRLPDRAARQARPTSDGRAPRKRGSPRETKPTRRPPRRRPLD